MPPPARLRCHPASQRAQHASRAAPPQVVLIRMDPANPSSNMVFRIRPHWRAFYAYLIGVTDQYGNRLPPADPAM